MAVRNAALKALASFLLAVELKAERQPFQELVPAMLQTIADALAASEEQECRDALEVFVEIAESQPTFLKKHVQGCVTGFINIASNVELEDSTRHLALEFLLTVAEQTPTVARKLPGFCASVVPVALQMMLDVEGDTPEELQARRRPRTHQADPTGPAWHGPARPGTPLPNVGLRRLRRLTAPHCSSLRLTAPRCPSTAPLRRLRRLTCRAHPHAVHRSGKRSRMTTRRPRSPTMTWARRRSTASPSVSLAAAPTRRHRPHCPCPARPLSTLTLTLTSNPHPNSHPHPHPHPHPHLTITAALGGKTMVPVLFSKIQEMFKSADWKQRHAALMAISQSGEGCRRASQVALSRCRGAGMEARKAGGPEGRRGGGAEGRRGGGEGGGETERAGERT